MIFREKLDLIISKRKSLLCVGLDSDITKIPAHLKREENPILAFNKKIIDATAEFTSSYKLNLAFYESYGLKGWQALAETVKYIPDEIVTIADAKRGDIGNTSEQYAKAFFDELGFDSITLSPYMGYDTVAPFIKRADKGLFLLCLTTNPGSKDFQRIIDKENVFLYKRVAEKVAEWDREAPVYGLVVGAQHPDELKDIRSIVPEIPFLIPGVGAQGGGLEGAVTGGTTKNGGRALINSSRGIIFSSTDEDFVEASGRSAEKLSMQIGDILAENY